MSRRDLDPLPRREDLSPAVVYAIAGLMSRLDELAAIDAGDAPS